MTKTIQFNQKIYKNISGIILAGGTNSRIGLDKVGLKFGEHTLLELIANKLGKLFSEILIVKRQNQKIAISNVKIFEDIFPGRGSIGGLYTGLVHSSNKYNFVCACDMPFVLPEIISVLINNTKKVDVVIPKINGYYEPLCAVYKKSCIHKISEKIKKNQLPIKDVLTELYVNEIAENELTTIDPNLFSFYNINTNNDYKKALEIYHRQKGFV